MEKELLRFIEFYDVFDVPTIQMIRRFLNISYVISANDQNI